MKAQHRHELKTNELAEWLASLPQLFEQHFRTILYVGIAVLVIILGGAYYLYQSRVVTQNKIVSLTQSLVQLKNMRQRVLQNQASGFDASYTLLPIAQTAQTRAKNAPEKTQTAFGLIEAANVLRAEMLYRQSQISDQEKTEQLDKAISLYNQAIQNAEGHLTLTALAEFGVALCNEDKGDFQLARQGYEDIVQNRQYKATIAFKMAQQRLATMDSYRTPVTFAEPPQPQMTELPQQPMPQVQLPTIQSADTAVNVPDETPQTVAPTIEIPNTVEPMVDIPNLPLD